MIFRILRQMFRFRGKDIILTTLAIFMGATLIASLLLVTSEISGKISIELRKYGANLIVVPKNAYLDETKLYKIKTIFWRHNIIGIAPLLSAEVTVNGKDKVMLTGTWFNKKVRIPDGTFFERQKISGGIVSIGIKEVSPWWKIKGKWITDSADVQNALVGESAAKKLNLKVKDRLKIELNGKTKILRVSGILKAGGQEDEEIFVNIKVPQLLLGLQGKAYKAKISAMIVPKAKLPESVRNKKLSEMTPKEYETWYCTPTIEAISKQITEVVPNARVKAIRQITEAESKTFSKIESIIILVISLGLVVSGLAVASTMTSAVLKRRSEIGLSKAIGATDQQIIWQFMVEAIIIGFTGGILGLVSGFWFAQLIGRIVFNTSISFDPFVLIITLVVSISIAVVGSSFPVRSAIKVKPVIALRG